MMLVIVIAAALYLLGFYRWVLRGGALAAHSNARALSETRKGLLANVTVDFVLQSLARAATYHLRLVWLGFLLWLGYLAYDEWPHGWALAAWAVLAFPVIHQLIVIW